MNQSSPSFGSPSGGAGQKRADVGGAGAGGAGVGGVVADVEIPLPEFQHSEPCPDQVWPLLLIHTAVIVVAAITIISVVLFVIKRRSDRAEERNKLMLVISEMYWTKENEIKTALQLFQEMSSDTIFRGVTCADLFAYRYRLDTGGYGDHEASTCGNFPMSNSCVSGLKCLDRLLECLALRLPHSVRQRPRWPKFLSRALGDRLDGFFGSDCSSLVSDVISPMLVSVTTPSGTLWCDSKTRLIRRLYSYYCKDRLHLAKFNKSVVSDNTLEVRILTTLPYAKQLCLVACDFRLDTVRSKSVIDIDISLLIKMRSIDGKLCEIKESAITSYDKLLSTAFCKARETCLRNKVVSERHVPAHEVLPAPSLDTTPQHSSTGATDVDKDGESKETDTLLVGKRHLQRRKSGTPNPCQPMMTLQRKTDYKLTLIHLLRLLHFAATMNELEDVYNEEMNQKFTKFISDLYTDIHKTEEQGGIASKVDAVDRCRRSIVRMVRRMSSKVIARGEDSAKTVAMLESVERELSMLSESLKLDVNQLHPGEQTVIITSPVFSGYNSGLDMGSESSECIRKSCSQASIYTLAKSASSFTIQPTSGNHLANDCNSILSNSTMFYSPLTMSASSINDYSETPV